MLNININENVSKSQNEINDTNLKSVLFNLINDIITGNFISSSNISNTYSLINTKYYQFKQYYTYNQNIGSLCGFHSLFNIYYFLQYLTTEENNQNKSYYLYNLRNAWSFWSFYKESINYLLNNLPLEPKAKESLVKGGPLERYQFIYLLKEFPKIKSLFNNISDNYTISFTKFLYGFGIFNGTMDEAMDFQEKFNIFMDVKNNNKEKILIVLLGIVNHWNILILHKNKENEMSIYFLDSRNYPEIFEPFELFDGGFNEDNNTEIKNMKDNFITREINKKNKKKSDWCITCLKDWYNSMNISMIIIFKLLSKKLNLLNYIIENKIKLLLNSFIDKTNIDLKNVKNDVNENDKNKIWKWIKEDYHPAYFNDNILIDFKKTKIQYKETSFINWIKTMELFLNKEKENKTINGDKKDIVVRYITNIDDLKICINFSS